MATNTTTTASTSSSGASPFAKPLPRSEQKSSSTTPASPNASPFDPKPNPQSKAPISSPSSPKQPAQQTSSPVSRSSGRSSSGGSSSRASSTASFTEPLPASREQSVQVVTKPLLDNTQVASSNTGSNLTLSQAKNNQESINRTNRGPSVESYGRNRVSPEIYAQELDARGVIDFRKEAPNSTLLSSSAGQMDGMFFYNDAPPKRLVVSNNLSPSQTQKIIAHELTHLQTPSQIINVEQRSGIRNFFGSGAYDLLPTEVIANAGAYVRTRLGYNLPQEDRAIASSVNGGVITLAETKIPSPADNRGQGFGVTAMAEGIVRREEALRELDTQRFVDAFGLSSGQRSAKDVVSVLSNSLKLAPSVARQALYDPIISPTSRAALQTQILVSGSKEQRAELASQGETQRIAAIESFLPVKSSTPFRSGGDISFNPIGTINLVGAAVGAGATAGSVLTRSSSPFRGISSPIEISVEGQLSPNGKALAPQTRLSFTQQSPTTSGLLGRQAQTTIDITPQGGITRQTVVGNRAFVFEQSPRSSTARLLEFKDGKLVSTRTEDAITLSSSRTAKVLPSRTFTEDPVFSREADDVFTRQTTVTQLPLTFRTGSGTSATGAFDVTFGTERTAAGSRQTVSGGAYTGQATLQTTGTFTDIAQQTVKGLADTGQKLFKGLSDLRVLSNKKAQFGIGTDTDVLGRPAGFTGTISDSNFAGRINPVIEPVVPELGQLFRPTQRPLSQPKVTFAEPLPSSRSFGISLPSPVRTGVTPSIITPPQIQSYPQIPSVQKTLFTPSTDSQNFVSPLSLTYSSSSPITNSPSTPEVPSITQPQTVPTFIPDTYVPTQPRVQSPTTESPFEFLEPFTPRIGIPRGSSGFPFLPVFNPDAAPNFGKQRRRTKTGKQRKQYAPDITSILFGNPYKNRPLPKGIKNSLSTVSGLGVRF